MNEMVSIIIPVYNGANYVRKAIDSALHQTYNNIEVIVVNDGSTDNGKTEKICLSYGDKIKYFYKKNGGVSSALNYGIKKMKGQYFSWLSHDDLYTSDRIEIMVNHLKYCDNKTILFSNYAYINENDKILYKTKFQKIKDLEENYELALLRGLLCGLTLLIPKQAFNKIGYFDENLKCVQDYMFFYKLMKNYKYKLVKQCTAYSRVHSKQVTLCSKTMQKENDFFWKFIIDNVQEDIIMKLDGSHWNYYNNLAKFLKYNNISDVAYQYCISKRNNYKKGKKYKHKKIVSVFSHFDKFIFYLRKDGILITIKKTARRIIK